MFLLKFLCIFVLLWKNSRGQYQIPEVTLEAFVPKGFRASIVADNETVIFGFHGRKNEYLNQIEPGDFTEDVKMPQNGLLTYYNPELSLNVGDFIHYWVYVQHSQFGYRKDVQKWEVKELHTLPNLQCEISETKVSGRPQVCSKTTVFNEDFDTLDRRKWTIEQYIPILPDFEFVIYKDDPTVMYINNGQLLVSPKLRSDQSVKENILDLSPGCTRKPPTSPQCRADKYLIQNPIMSGKIFSNQMFTYGDVEIRAKLPAGDWIYPEIYLENDNGSRIMIAYARGNKALTGNNGDDIGGSLLFGGPMHSHIEPDRSSKLSSTKISSGLYSDSFHVYRLIWSKRGMKLYVDGKIYGDIPAATLDSSDFTGAANQVRLVLGVGVGGISDFPDDYKSGDIIKPWINGEKRLIKNFYENRAKWQPTWTEAALAVDYVKIRAI